MDSAAAAPTWVDVIDGLSKLLLIALIPWATIQWNKWRGAQLSVQQKIDQDRAVTTAVLSVQQDAIKSYRQTGSVLPGPARLVEAIHRARSLEPQATSRMTDQELELRVEANVAALAIGSIRPPGLSSSLRPPSFSLFPPPATEEGDPLVERR